jgi:hypothetical protein
MSAGKLAPLTTSVGQAGRKERFTDHEEADPGIQE